MIPDTEKLQKLLFKAAKVGDTPQVDELLEQDPSLIQARDPEGSTPLHCAAWKGQKEVVALLLSRGADVTVQNTNTHWGGTPLHAAAHANQRAIAELLIHHGADIHARSCNGRTPMDETAIHNATAVAKLLQQHGAGAPS